MLLKIIGTIGIVVNFLGILLLFYFGFPQPDFTEGVGLRIPPATVLADGRKIADLEEASRRKKKKYNKISKIALALIGCGMLFQLLCFWI